MFRHFKNYLPFVQKNATDFSLMEARVAGAMAAHNLTYLQLLRALAVDCDQFVLFVRDKSFGPELAAWPAKCGTIFSTVPPLDIHIFELSTNLREVWTLVHKNQNQCGAWLP